MAEPAPTSGTLSPAVDRCWFWPFVLPAPVLALKLFIYNGATLAGNIDLGIYTSDFARLVSAGTTAQANTNALQEVDTADTYLDRGQYYFAMAQSSATATFFQTLWHVGANSEMNKMIGTLTQQTTFPLPAVATPQTMITEYGVVIMGLSGRVLVV